MIHIKLTTVFMYTSKKQLDDAQLLKMLPKYLKCITPTYYFSYIFGVLPLKFKNGKFVFSSFGFMIWLCQFIISVLFNWYAWSKLRNNPCNNALSCAIFIQSILNGVTVLLQVSLIIIQYKKIKTCLNSLLELIERLDEFDLTLNSIRLPVLCYNCLFKLITLVRCAFMFIAKPKSSPIEIVPYFTTLTQIEIENTEITLFYVASVLLEALNLKLISLRTDAGYDDGECLRKLQSFHNSICEFCATIENAFSLNITISVITVLSQLLLMTYFEITLNIKPIRRKILVELYLVMNVAYVIMNLLRISAISNGCSKVHQQYANTNLQLQRLVSSARDDQLANIAYFTAQLQLRSFKFTGCNLFTIDTHIITEIVSVVSIYATTMVSFTTFSADTKAVYTSYLNKNNN